MIKQILFRSAELADLEFIVELLADDPLGSKRQTSDLQYYISAFKKIQSDANQELIVATLDDQIVGTFQLSFIQYLTYSGGLRGQIEAVRVKTDFRHQGIGEQLFGWAIQRAKEKGAHLLQLTTDKMRPDAKRFYEKMGFIASHEGMKLHL